MRTLTVRCINDLLREYQFFLNYVYNLRVGFEYLRPFKFVFQMCEILIMIIKISEH